MENRENNEIFNFENNPETDVQRVPAPTKKGKTAQKVWKIIGCVLLAAILFASGALTFWFSLDKGMRKLIWIKDKIDDKYYQDISNDEFYSTLYDAVNNDLLDPYSYYMTAEEFKTNEQTLAGKRGGIGAMLLTQDADGNEQILITRVSGNSPAEKAGLLEGDKIIAFGAEEDGLTESQNFNVFSTFLSGMDTGKTVFLRVLSNGEEKTVSLAKEVYVENYVFYRTNTSSYAFTGGNNSEWTEKGNALTALPDQTAYIRLIQFSGNASRGVATAMDQFRQDGKTDLILDLRGNTGGYLDVMQEIAAFFGKNAKGSTPLAVLADYGNKKVAYNARGNVYENYFKPESRIFVLADIDTASASECLIGFMLDYGALSYENICLSERGGVAKTYGKGIMQTTYYLDWFEKDALKLTTAEIRWPVSKTSIHGRGILPEDGAKTVKEAYGKDLEINAAIAQLYS
ncbi:MAG: PDZ domain-containing protein [Clostridia bacterium]|nr:PDZ domain-containing protein [Clostridia bacterium]